MREFGRKGNQNRGGNLGGVGDNCEGMEDIRPVMKKLGLGLLALMFFAPLVVPADAQVVVRVGPRHHYHHYYHHHYYHHYR